MPVVSFLSRHDIRGRDLIKSAKSGGFFGPKKPKEQIRYRNDTEIYPRFRTERGCVLITQQNLQKFEFFYCAPLKIQIFANFAGFVIFCVLIISAVMIYIRYSNTTMLIYFDCMYSKLYWLIRSTRIIDIFMNYLFLK